MFSVYNLDAALRVGVSWYALGGGENGLE